MLTIFEYQKANEFLRDRWEEKKKKNPSFSLRAWSKKLGFESNAPLSLMMAGKRPVPKKYIPKFIKDLDLSPNEGLYLEALIEANKTKDPVAKEHYLKRMKELSPKKNINFVELDLYNYLQDPIHGVILEAMYLQKFYSDEKWIKKNLCHDRSLKEVKGALERLESLGLIENLDGVWTRTTNHVTSTRDVPKIALKNFHRNVSEYAAKAVYEQSVDKREYNNYFFNLKPEVIPEAKKEIRQFIKSFLEKYESEPGQGQETYSLNIQLFKVFGGHDEAIH